MQISEKIIDRIKKLLELASSPNENESKLAMEQAQKLMERYSISSIETEGASAKTIERSEYQLPIGIPRSPALLRQLPIIADCIGNIFGCFASMTPTATYLNGFFANVRMTSYALDCILNQAQVEYREGYKKAKSITFSHGFWEGFTRRLRERFTQLAEVGNALVVYDPIQAAKANLKTALIKGISASEAAYTHGANVADSVQIRKPIAHGDSGKLLS